jgi:hypothetical protein
VSRVALRFLAAVAALTGGDYLLWSWSVAGNHGVLSIVAGVTLVPLFILLVVACVRVAGAALGWAGRRTAPRGVALARQVPRRGAHRTRRAAPPAHGPRGPHAAAPSASDGASGPPSRRVAA